MANPLGHRLESHTKTLTQGGMPPESVESFSYDWRRVWDEGEVPHYEGGSRVVGKIHIRKDLFLS